MTYYLRPPTIELPMSFDPRDNLWSRVKHERGQTIHVYNDGRVTLVDVADTSDPNIVKTYLGGHTSELTTAERDTLVNAGYGAFISEVP